VNVRFGIDVETGGFEPGRHALLAIGCWWSTGAGVDRGLKVRVHRERGAVVEPDAMRCNGWRSDEQWADLGAVPLRAAVWQLLDFVESLQRVTRAEKLVAVAHNSPHDWSFIERALLSCGGGTYPLERWEDHVSRHWRCSMRLLHSAMDAGIVASGSGSLDRLIEVSRQLPRPGVHDPRDDARYALNGYEWLLTQINDCGARRIQPIAA
jgi:DNA polymerase III epsilon subunit-like protein